MSPVQATEGEPYAASCTAKQTTWFWRLRSHCLPVSTTTPSWTRAIGSANSSYPKGWGSHELELDRREGSRHDAWGSRHEISQWIEPQDELADQIHKWLDTGAQAQLSEEIQCQPERPVASPKRPLLEFFLDFFFFWKMFIFWFYIDFWEKKFWIFVFFLSPKFA